MRSILVLRGGALGDFLVTLPALKLLRTRWPEARIELAGNHRAAALGVRAGLLDHVSSQHDRCWSALYADVPLPPGLQERLAAFDLVLNFWPDHDRTLGRHFPLRPGQRYLSASAFPATAPAASHFCAPLRALGLIDPDFAPRLAEPGSQPAGVALHPGSGSPNKNWPLDRWRALAGQLRVEMAAPLFVLSGEAESDGILAGCGEAWRNLPLPELLRRLSRCRLFIGHDSGVSHLAAAAGIPCLLLFGPTEPALWAPPHPTVKTIRNGPSLDSITVSQVRAAVAEVLSSPA